MRKIAINACAANGSGLRMDGEFTVVSKLQTLFMKHFNSLAPRVKPWVIQRLLTFDSMDRNLRCDHSVVSC